MNINKLACLFLHLVRLFACCKTCGTKQSCLQTQYTACLSISLALCCFAVPSTFASTFSSAFTTTTNTALTELDLTAVPAPFKATFKFHYKWLKIGQADYVFESLPIERSSGLNVEAIQATHRFSLKSYIGFFLLKDKRRVSSDFAIQAQSLLPIQYKHQRSGTGDDYDETVRFDQQQILVEANFLNKQYQLVWTEVIKQLISDAAVIPQAPEYLLLQDGLSVQFQLFMDVRANPEQVFFDYAIAERFGIMHRRFINEGIDTIHLKINGEKRKLRCRVLSVAREQVKQRTLMYFAEAYGYLPVQLVHYNDGKKQFSANLHQHQTF